MYPPKFKERLVNTTAGLCITKAKQEIDIVLNALARAGFFYKTNKTLYLNFVEAPDGLWTRETHD